MASSILSKPTTIEEALERGYEVGGPMALQLKSVGKNQVRLFGTLGLIREDGERPDLQVKVNGVLDCGKVRKY